ncbi:radical SAM protein [Desulforhopalus singaporensis]|uniref:Radical SAM core domain-containing protein n=1 Tax=Desulforhopalus singaporensis TaxID=91360 RepID=A0A1H0J103_9BACT|nr:radical SAM protein [Desulforhopalus singaporensis]SDO37386.1 hypothetical protein SAMN05660330_00106 [Desulforhopalus singaporensis]
MNTKPIKGTREWAVAEINCSLGCPNDCRYCYARAAALRSGKIAGPGEWKECVVLAQDPALAARRYGGQIMFPSVHDIVEENIDASVKLLKSLLGAGNRVLIVSKPRLACIKSLCAELVEFRDNIQFRFTITARDDAILRFWEPGAPSYRERVASLEYAFAHGFTTSVSVEPMLDFPDVVAMVYQLLPYVSATVWLGKMNKIDERIRTDSARTEEEIARIKKGQADKNICALYHQLKELAQIRWKESIKSVVGLPLVQEPGLDI